MKVENSTYYCANTKGETVGIPIVEIGLVGKYYNEKELQNFRKEDKWTFHYQIPEKLAAKHNLRWWGSTVNAAGYRTHGGVIIAAAPVATEIEVANVWNAINDFHNKAYCDTVTRGRAEEFVV